MALCEQTEAIHRDFETDLDRAQDMASIRFERLLAATLKDWSLRFPRHKFNALEGHGLISIEVSPPVMGETYLGCLEAKNYRGAVAELVEDTRILVDAYCVEYRSTLCFSPVNGD